MFAADCMDLIETGNLEDDLPRLNEADWIIEVVKEDMAIKKIVLKNAAPHIGPQAIFSSNTSGLSLTEMAAVLPPELQARFLGTHFFNPPRYMKLFELIPTAKTDPQVTAFVADFARRRLGKGIVMGKDTPNFIANRVGVHAMMATIKVMQEMALSIEEIDALTGPAIGRPKTATFQLADLVGLDTFLHVADNIYPLIPDDEARDVFKTPDYLRRWWPRDCSVARAAAVSTGWIKEPQKKSSSRWTSRPWNTATSRRRSSPRSPRPASTTCRRACGTLAFGQGHAGQAIWRLLAASFSYSAMRVGEICDQAAQIDQAVCWGFNWELGPFETWDALGFRAVVERMRADGLPLPAWVDALYAAAPRTSTPRWTACATAPPPMTGVFAAGAGR